MPREPLFTRENLEFLNLGYVACHIAEDDDPERYRVIMFWLVYPKNFRIGL